MELANAVTAGWNSSRFTSVFQEPVYREEAAGVGHDSSLQMASWTPAPFAEFKVSSRAHAI